MKRRDRLGDFLSPGQRFWTGISLIPGFFFIDSLAPKLSLVVLFSILAGLSGKRIRYFYFLTLTASITFFHLLTPSGRILWEIGPFPVTAGSLEAGVFRGITLSGLVFLSLFSISYSLKLPGHLGGMIGRMFFYFEEILEHKGKIRGRQFISSLDAVLLDVFPPERKMEAEALPTVHIHKAGRILSLFYTLVLELLVWGNVLREQFL